MAYSESFDMHVTSEVTDPHEVFRDTDMIIRVYADRAEVDLTEMNAADVVVKRVQ